MTVSHSAMPASLAQGPVGTVAGRSYPVPMSERVTHRPPTWLIWLALGTVYVIWSTTYLGIRVPNETLPPLLAAGTRFVIAGSVLLAVTVRRGDTEADPVGRTQWLPAVSGGGPPLAGRHRAGRLPP